MSRNKYSDSFNLKNFSRVLKSTEGKKNQLQCLFQYLLYNNRCQKTRQFIAHRAEKLLSQRFYKYPCAIHMPGQHMLNNDTCK